jgi:chromate transporter
MTTPAPPRLRTLTLESLRIGALGFGGPAGQIALMHQAYVSDKKWIDEDQYLHALSYCMLLPGPEAQQLATYIGWRLNGVVGGLVAGLGFVVPGALIMLGLSWLYMSAQNLSYFEPVLVGIRAAVLVLIASAVMGLANKAIKDPFGWSVAGGSFIALLVLHVPFPIVIIAALAMGWWRAKPAPDHLHKQTASVNSKKVAANIVIWLVVWLSPLGLVLALNKPLLAEIGIVFSGLSVVTFGGAYASSVWIKQYAVDSAAWLTPQNMLDGLGLVQTIPGPLVLINQFVGFLAGWKEGGIGLALAGAAMASWCTQAHLMQRLCGTMCG